jgi:hypothetical protein
MADLTPLHRPYRPLWTTPAAIVQAGVEEAGESGEPGAAYVGFITVHERRGYERTARVPKVIGRDFRRILPVLERRST